MSQQRIIGWMGEGEDERETAQGVTLDNPMESADLYAAFNKLDTHIYTVEAQLDVEGKVTSFDVFRAGADGQPPQKVFSADDKTKTCSFSQPFDPAIINTYVNKAASQLPEKILQISSCESFETLQNFLQKYEESPSHQQIKFHVPDSVVDTIIQKELAKLTSSFEDQKKSTGVEKSIRDYLKDSTFIAKPEEVAALLEKRKNAM